MSTVLEYLDLICDRLVHRAEAGGDLHPDVEQEYHEGLVALWADGAGAWGRVLDRIVATLDADISPHRFARLKWRAFQWKEIARRYRSSSLYASRLSKKWAAKAALLKEENQELRKELRELRKEVRALHNDVDRSLSVLQANADLEDWPRETEVAYDTIRLRLLRILNG